MKKIIASVAVAASLSGAAPATAAPYLGAGEAARSLGRILHQKYYVQRGSLDVTCWALARNRRRCQGTFTFQSGACGFVTSTIRETYTTYYHNYRVSYCD